MIKAQKTVITQSLIIPIYNNAENIPSLLHALDALAQSQGPELEVVFVVDGPSDHSYELLLAVLPTLSFSAQLITHSRNFGSFAAIRTGMGYAKGTAIAVMAADLQEPPQLIEQFFDILKKDAADVVFGQRIERHDPPVKKFLSNFYWKFYGKVVQPEIPKGGVDIFACNSRVRDTILNMKESHGSLIGQLFWVGYRRSFIPYVRLERKQGKSGWSLKKRIRYMMDSIFAYSDFPIMFILYAGIAGLIVTSVLASIIVINKIFFTINVPGYAATMLTLLFFGSLILITQGIIGCYIWLIFENSKKRPLSLVDKVQENILSE
jgi:glycosyltransferase involved in cell wall biosynthesis